MHDALTFMDPATAARVIRTLDTHVPSIWEDYLNLSSAFFVVGETDLALTNARLALSLERAPEALLNLAVILESQGKFHQAFSLSMEAASLSESSTILCHATDSLLRMGWFEEAWRLGYSHSHANWSDVAEFLPEWNGHASLAGKRILVLPGGGYGDEILFLRWMPRLADLGADVTYVCMPTLAPLVQSLPYIHYIRTGATTDTMLCGLSIRVTKDLLCLDYNYFVGIRSLMEYFCPSPESIPTRPYLFADPIKSAERRDMLHGDRDWPLVGLCTRAGEESFPRRHRSLTDDQTARILHAHAGRGFEWVSLNYEHSIMPGMLQPAIRDWSDTAAIFSTLDLVVTVDTGVAHLAGAMGIPCWLLLPGISAAYYGIEGSSCWFYPTHVLFRNGGEGIDDAISEVCSALEKL